MFLQLFGLAGVQTPLLLIFIESIFAVLTRGTFARSLRRERRRRLRRETASLHYVRSMEDFPELASDGPVLPWIPQPLVHQHARA